MCVFVCPTCGQCAVDQNAAVDEVHGGKKTCVHSAMHRRARPAAEKRWDGPSMSGGQNSRVPTTHTNRATERKQRDGGKRIKQMKCSFV